jgi:hypothetical protein
MFDSDLAAEISQPAHEAADGLGLVPAGELLGAEVTLWDTARSM